MGGIICVMRQRRKRITIKTAATPATLVNGT
jgi:hypothetical protein